MISTVNRMKRLRGKIKEMKLDASYITKRENYLYLSGFTGSHAHLLITKDHAVLLTDFRYMEQAKKQAVDFEVHEIKGKSAAFLQEFLWDFGIKSLGFEDGFMTCQRNTELKEKLTGIKLSPLGDTLEVLRYQKETEEIEIIKRAVKISDDAFIHILPYIKPDVRENEIAAEIEYFMKQQGAAGSSFETIVASGKRASLPHGIASTKRIEKGDVVTLDYGCIYENYCSDMTRTVFVGQPDKQLTKIYEIVKKAQQKASDFVKSGILGKDVDLVARDIISEYGYKDCFGHGLGHSVGLEIHEEPRLSPSGNIMLSPGVVVTVEPGIYIEGLGGVRIEDMLVVTEGEPEVLTGSTKEQMIL